jgi:hypothetical protein
MNKITSTQTNYTAPAAGYAEGTFKDDPGDGSGSSIIVKNYNDVWYALAAPVLKYKGALADTDEKTTQSDFQDAVERAIGIQNENVSEWSNTTTYAQDDHAMYLGIQFVSMVGSNTGNNPIDNPDKWLPCWNRDDAILKYRNCDCLTGGLEAIHDARDAGYRQYFKFGKYNYGGDSGRNFQAYGVHLDGSTVTGNPLATIFDVGGANEYPYIDIIAPDVAGTRTMLDARGCVMASIDQSGVADRAAIGVRQEDQFQGHRFYNGAITVAAAAARIFNYGSTTNEVPGVATGEVTTGVVLGTEQGLTSLPKTDGTNGTPRTGTETRMKNFSVGVPYIITFVEI